MTSAVVIGAFWHAMNRDLGLLELVAGIAVLWVTALLSVIAFGCAHAGALVVNAYKFAPAAITKPPGVITGATDHRAVGAPVGPDRYCRHSFSYADSPVNKSMPAMVPRGKNTPPSRYVRFRA